MVIKIIEKCFVKTSKGYIAMAFYENHGEKRWGILAPLETVELCETQFIKAIKDFCFSHPRSVFIIDNDREIHFGFEAYQWYLQGLCQAKPIEDYLDEDTVAYCIIRDNKGRQRAKRFSTSAEMERIIQLRRKDILSFGLVEKGCKVAKDIARYVLIHNDQYIRYNIDGSVELCDFKNATIFPSKRMASATASGCPYKCKPIKYESAKTYNGRRFVIALITNYSRFVYVKSVTQLGFATTNIPSEARRFYKKQGEEYIEKMYLRFDLTPSSKFKLVELNEGGIHDE